MAGFGNQPCGTTPYGVGTPALAPVVGGSALRDTNTGLQDNSRYINPATGRYEFDANGRAVGMSSVNQLVQLAVTTNKGTSAFRGLGNELYKVDRITDNLTRRVTDVFTSALSDLINQKLITLLSVDVQQAGNSRVYVVIRWRDLTSNTEETLTV